MNKQKTIAIVTIVLAGTMPFLSFAQMATTTTEITGALNTSIGVAWTWALAIVAIMFLFALGTNALNAGLRTVLRQVKKLFRL